MRNFGKCLKVRNIVARISDRFDKDCLCAVIDGRSNVLCLVTIDKLGCDAQAGKQDLELVIGATIQIAGGYNVITGMGKC